ncbi:copper resistance protein CopD [Nakamurella sp. YIM 132087]|uniref:Copper resistance protein CopD n=1 Tax=Nakamurella alba TaxID=2665158 RepID=A0A7K1FKR7_9ACTN|nr:cytochrome c oxidase assembly protein [Nakamurella alba]MTD13464.1 copper resistance protein CopD [Nakamurella alba]
MSGSSSIGTDDPPAGAPEGSAPTRRRDPWTVTSVSIAAVLMAMCVAGAVAAIVPTRGTATGIVDASRAVQLSVPIVHGIYDMAAAFTIGWLVAAVFFCPPQRSGLLDVGGYRAMRAAALSALVWLVSALALVPITIADEFGRPFGQAIDADLVLTAIAQLDTVRGFVISAAFVVLVAVIAWSVLRPGWAFLLLILAFCALLPQAAGGHASSDSNHDVAVDTMLYHLVGITVWIGGLIAFLGLARQKVPFLTTIARRYSATALVAFVLVGLSGMGNAWVRLTYIQDLWTTPYGRLLIIKTVLLIVLGVIGYAHRQRTLPALATGERRPLVRLAVVEVLIMAATVGVATALSRTATPPPSGAAPSQTELELGFSMPGPPDLWRFITAWRFDWLVGGLTVVAAVVYVLAVIRIRRKGIAWPPGRTVAWLLGCLLVLIATSSGLGRYAQTQFSLHMVAHMILGMLAPILLVLGGPTTLALRALPTAPRGGPPGAREALVAVLNSRLTRVLTHPLFVLPLFIGSFYAVYFTGLFETLMSSHLGHVFMNVHFLVVGYLYYWVIIGVDPAPRRWPHIVKLGILLAALPFHAFFGLALMNSRTAMATNYYQSLQIPWVGDLAADQRLGGGIAWGITELPMLIVLVALLAQWARTEERQNRTVDRQKDERGDAELDAYNQMLAGLAERGRRGSAAGSPKPDASESTGDPGDRPS